MNIMRFRTALVAAAAFVGLFAGANHASAAVSVGIQVGGPPPPPPAVVYRPWAPPYRGAVWIAGHNEWVDGRWVWVGGYYAYPPYRGAVWIPGRYRHGYWRPGHWA
jgi:hypothetical protein